MRKDILTNVTKRVGNFVAAKTKDTNNQLFKEVSEEAINAFIDEIEKSSPALAALIREWEYKETKTNYTRNTESDSGGCGFTPTKKHKTCGGCYGSGGC
jgi:hypothetical protein